MKKVCKEIMVQGLLELRKKTESIEELTCYLCTDMQENKRKFRFYVV